MDIADSFEEPKLLIQGAREDIQKLEIRGQSFVEGCRCTPVEEYDPQPDEKILKLRITNKIPGQMRVTASKALNNLRHALDQAINTAAVELGARRRDNYFPFAKDVGELDRAIKQRCPSVPAEIVSLIKAFQPYGGGDDLLYFLSKISGPNKRQILLKLNANFSQLMINASPKGPVVVTGPCVWSYGDWDSVKQELEIARVGRGGRVRIQNEIKIFIFLSISNNEITVSEPVSTLLKTLARKVEDILVTIEAKTSSHFDRHMVPKLDW